MNDIKELITTGFERDNVVNFLDQFDQIIFNSAIDVKSYIAQHVPPYLQLFLATFLTQTGLSSDNLFAQSKVLRAQVNSIPTITLTTPFVPDFEMARRIGTFARKTTGMPVLIDFNLDLTILGGAVVEGNGKVAEHSFRQYFEEKLKGGKHGI